MYRYIAESLSSRHPKEAESLWKDSIDLLTGLLRDFRIERFEDDLVHVTKSYTGFLVEHGRRADAATLLNDLVREFPNLETSLDDLNRAIELEQHRPTIDR